MSRSSSLIVTLGYPGSGKTYFSQQWCARFGFYHLNSDKTRLTMFESPSYSPDENRALFRFMDLLAEDLLRSGVSVLYDANVNKRIYRQKLEEIASRTDSSYQLIWFKTPLEIAEQRLQSRRQAPDADRNLMYRPVDDEVLYRLKDEFEDPDKEERHFIIDGQLPFEKQCSVLAQNLDLLVASEQIITLDQR